MESTNHDEPATDSDGDRASGVVHVSLSTVEMTEHGKVGTLGLELEMS